MLKLIINHEMKSISILSFNVWFGMVLPFGCIEVGNFTFEKISNEKEDQIFRSASAEGG